MNPEQVALQLGLAGLIVLVVYRVVVLFLNRWGKVQEARAAEEARRTDAIAAGFGAIASSIARFAEDDIKSHGELAERVDRFEGKRVPAAHAARRRARIRPGLPARRGFWRELRRGGLTARAIALRIAGARGAV